VGNAALPETSSRARRSACADCSSAAMRDQIDALDELPEATQQILRRAVADARRR
jgi:hypothetical protein